MKVESLNRCARYVQHHPVPPASNWAARLSGHNAAVALAAFHPRGTLVAPLTLGKIDPATRPFCYVPVLCGVHELLRVVHRLEPPSFDGWVCYSHFVLRL
jgi:hypothetical protein